MIERNGFTLKQFVFVNEYLKCRNASEAARRAGYAFPRSQGSRLLTNVAISEEVARRTKHHAMEADEVLARLGDIARASVEDFTEVVPGMSKVLWLDLEKAQRRNKMHLIKKYRYTDKNQLEFELHDALSALKTIAQLLDIGQSVEDNTEINIVFNDKTIQLQPHNLDSDTESKDDVINILPIQRGGLRSEMG